MKVDLIIRTFISLTNQQYICKFYLRIFSECSCSLSLVKFDKTGRRGTSSLWIFARPSVVGPGSAYHRIACQVADWLKIVPECNINTSSKFIADGFFYYFYFFICTLFNVGLIISSYKTKNKT